MKPDQCDLTSSGSGWLVVLLVLFYVFIGKVHDRYEAD